MKKWWHWALGLAAAVILVAAGWLRLWRLGVIPAGATVDEVNYGYIAYSLVRTGRDEHGVAWPLVFQAYGDQKLPGQVYLLVPLVKFFGLSLTITRLPAALASLALLGVIYGLARAWRFRPGAALVATLLWAVAPAPFILGRGAWESNLAMAAFAFGLLGLGEILFGRCSSRWRRLLAVLAWSGGWAGAWYCYIPYRPITLIAAGLALVSTWWPGWDGARRRRLLAGGLALGAVLVAPLLVGTRSATNLTRFSQLGDGVVADLELTVNERRTFCQYQGQLPRWWCDAIYNKLTLEARSLVRQLVSALGVDFLALTAETELDVISVAGYGEIPLLAYGLALLGAIALIAACWQGERWVRVRAVAIAVLLGLALAPAIAVGSAQKVRLSPLFPVLFLLVAWGWEWVGALWRRYIWPSRASALAGVVVLVAVVGYTLFDALSFATDYFAYNSFHKDWQTLGYVPRLDALLAQLAPARIFWHVGYPDALMFYAFDTQLDPAVYQAEIVLSAREATGWQHPVRLGERLVQTSDNLETLACEQEASSSGQTLVVEQDGELVRSLSDYWLEHQEKIATASAQPLWLVRSINQAQVLAVVVDLDWYRETFCRVASE